MILVQSFATLVAVVVIFNISVVQASPVPNPISKTLFSQATDARNDGLHGQKRIFDIILEANSMASSTFVGRLEGEESLFQGDIVMTDDIREALRTSGTDSMTLPPRGKSTNKRAVSSTAHHKWPKVNGVVEVPYAIQPSSVPDQTVIKKAINHWTQKVPCITFVPRTTQKDYISFFAGQGCYSWTGRTGGKQRISIGSGCAKMGVIAHEIGHALGFWHEQSRPDRDSYVKILWNNIQTGKANDFKKIMGGDTNDLGVAYDFNSLMHYGSTAFAKAAGLNTIEKLDGSIDFGQTFGLSNKDIQQAKLLYCQGSVCKHKDNSTHCPTWGSYGYCDKSSIYHRYMVTNCGRTCLCKV